jgi:ectoine hydroxylase-related dioxygenase (phytanoyl-CoA dioxygenase family)
MQNSDSRFASDTLPAFQRDGFAVVPAAIDAAILNVLRSEFTAALHPRRDLLARASVRELSRSRSIRGLAESVLGRNCFAVRGLFFNKTKDANWKVAWHQDLTIAVQERRETSGYAGWSMKHGIVHVQPPGSILENMLAIRIHLDENREDNGPLRCIPRSHASGRLSADDIFSLDKSTAVTCCAPVGAALVMRPLVVHASSRCTSERARRVIHLEFANASLPGELNWKDQC